jgi:16S rRNA (uracil1498-N3)-methyltransferase
MLSLFYITELTNAPSIEIVGDEAHHAINVMRLGIGDRLLISDGNGHWAEGVISSSNKKSFILEITQRGEARAANPKLSILQALTKSDRTKELVELLVEGGVDRIIPWQAENSIAKWQEGASAKWRSTVIAAGKQSRRFALPKVEDAIRLVDLPAIVPQPSLLVVMHESAEQKLSDCASKIAEAKEEIILVVGPEGGLSERELHTFSQMGAQIVSLGDHVFRSAHAGIAGLAAIQTLLKRY